MSRRVFEYFFEPEEFEPLFTDMFGRLVKRSTKPSASASDEESMVNSSTSGDPEAKIYEIDEETETRIPPTQDTSETTTTFASRGIDFVSNGVDDLQDSNGHKRGRVRQLVSVHALGQFLYCRRSAILATELGDTRDADERVPRLTYQPNFTLEKIEEAWRNRLLELGTATMSGLGMCSLLAHSRSIQNRPLFQLAFICLAMAVLAGIWLLVDFVSLSFQMRAAKNAEALEPLPSFTGIENANWWSILKCGFDIVDHDQPFRHPELALEGNPWRVLERDSLRIPVLKSGADKLGDRPGELYPKHQIRLAAHALLLEATRNAKVPYGLVFPCNSPHGLALAITPALRQKAIRVLDEFVQGIEQSQRQRIEPRMPEQRSRCSGCSYGKPEQITVKEIKAARKQGKELLVLRRENGKEYHCQCGDRFGSAPPHRDSIGMGLAVSLDDE